jgi:TfoX/Sxy family transcriptional regulator of competence genes
MVYNKTIEARIQRVAIEWENCESKKMFGGVCFLLKGNMVCGAYKDFLILRLGQENAEKALQEPFTRPFDITGRPMKGWIMVESKGFHSEKKLRDWLEKARTFVSTLPIK